MEEIKVGEYVRTTDGVIAKIIDIIKEDYGERGNLLYSLDRETFDYTEGFEEMSDFALPDQFVKHSKNIIDLIEVGDIIKYKELTADDKYGTIVNEKYIGDVHTESDLKCVKEEIERKGIELLAILTKERFKSECYEVEGNELNIFELNEEEIEKELDKIFENTTPKELLQELIECGLEVKEGQDV